MPLSSDQFAEFETRLKNELPDHVVAVEYDEDPEDQGTIAVEIKDVAWQYYVTGICRTILRVILEEPFSVSLLVIPVTRIGESEGLFGLTYRGGVNSFFIHYYAPERQRNKPFTVPVYYRKLIDVLRIIPTKKGPSLENAEVIWNRLFSTSYEVLARQQGIHTFTASNLAARLRQFLIDVIDEIKEIAESKGDRIALISSVHRPPVKVPIDKTSYQGKGYQIASQQPAIVWVSPHIISERIDAHPFQPSFIQIDEMLAERADSVRLGEKIRQEGGLAGGATPLGAKYLKEGIRFIRSQNIAPNWIDLSDVVYISPEGHQMLERSVLETDDLLLTITGSFTSAVVYPESLPANISQHSVRVHFNEDINPRFVSAYLNSKFGQAQIQQQQVGLTRPAIDYDGVKTLRLPMPDRLVQDYIGEKVYFAERCFVNAHQWLKEAVLRFVVLSKESDFIPRRESHNFVPSEDIKDRLASEFYLPLYFDLENHLNSLEIEIANIGSLLREPIIRSSTPERFERGNIPAILTSDIEPYFIETQHPTLWIDQATYEKPNVTKLRTNDVVYTSVGPPVGEAAVVLEQHLPMVLGGDVSVLRCGDRLEAGYLSLFLNSIFGQMQNERFARGVRQRRVYPEDIGAFWIPVLQGSDQLFINRRIIAYEILFYKGRDLITEAEADIEALIEGRLDIKAVMEGKLIPPAWEDFLRDVESGINA